MVGFTLTTELKKMPVEWETEPTPAWAMFTLSALAFRYSRNPFRSLAGKSFLATITIGVPAARPMGAKSLVGSYFKFGYRAGAAPWVPMWPIMMV
jgi:hypothetical protein